VQSQVVIATKPKDDATEPTGESASEPAGDR
jgi:hypothetical protein